MNQEMKFKNIVAQYSNVAPEEITNNMRFREDLGFSSLDFMSFLGELEDTFDIELEESEVMKIVTIGEALELLDNFQQEEVQISTCLKQALGRKWICWLEIYQKKVYRNLEKSML